MAITGDIVVDVSAEPDANPYSNAALTTYGDNLRVFSGKFRIWDQGGFYTTDAPTQNVVTSRLELGDDNGDSFGPALINTSNNGFMVECRFDNLALYNVNAGIKGTLINGSIGTPTLIDGSVVEFSIDNTTGAWEVLVDDVSQATGTNATYNDLRAGYHFQAQDYANTGGKSFAGDGYAASTSIAQTDTTPEDGVQQTVTCTGMTGPITAATLGGYDILSLLSGTDPASPITYTLDISALAEGTNASLPRLGVSLDLVFTTATDGAVTQSGIVIQPKTGWALVELEDTINKDANGLGATIEADTGITITNVDAVYHETANNASITVNLVYTSDLTTAGQSTKIILQDGGTSPATSYSDGFYPYGESGGGSNVPKTKYRRFPWQPWNPL